ncbi:recombinase family protein [Bradyrhizobium yuanmingense]|uniref:recombinase family protein n=1 Tax=Bradyrhizobium yuanmingense TaxID=108015 RepID=UPI003B979090
MPGSPRPRERELRAVQYVRMSTDRQQYSIANQMAVAAAYAAEHRLTIVRPYIDERHRIVTCDCVFPPEGARVRPEEGGTDEVSKVHGRAGYRGIKGP